MALDQNTCTIIPDLPLGKQHVLFLRKTFVWEYLVLINLGLCLSLLFT